MSDLNSLTLAQARDGLKKKNFSAAELADAHLAAIEKARALNAYVLETPERAPPWRKPPTRASRPARRGRWKAFRSRSRTCSAPKDVRSTACSHILDNFVPTYDSTVTANLWRDGAVLLGKTNNDEFAMGSSNETSHFGPVISPWRRKGANTPLTPGGSSGGSAAAVAAQLCLGATGTDTGGSIRQPAAFTGTVGIKPTYGRCSRWGIVAFASSLDQAGPFAQDRARRRDPAALDGRTRRQGHHLRRSAGARLRSRRRQIGEGPAHRHSRRNTGSTACRPRSRKYGSKGGNG